MNAQTEQLIYWKQQADYNRDKYAEANEQLDDIMEITDELEQAVNKALIEICATCVYPDRPYDPESFPQLENPEDRKCLANAITILRDALSEGEEPTDA